jgi:HK97 gp10 family phage protein
MATDAANNAPEESGRLGFSIAVSERRTARAKTTFNKARGVQIAMGPATGQGTLHYAAFVEFGTDETPAQPFMRPAWDRGAMKSLNYIIDNLWIEIDKAVGRVARRKAKLAAR